MWQGGRVQRARAGGRPLEQRWISGGLPTVGQAGEGCRSQQKRPMRCSYSMEHTARAPLGQSHEIHDSLIDSLKSHFRKERKDNSCLKITVARSEAKKNS